jgi:hypothetical protein
MGPEDLERLTNTTDLYGLLGENGFLGKLELDVGYMPTDYLGDALSGIDRLTGGLFNLGGRPMENIGPAAEKAQEAIDALPDEMPLAEKGEAIKAIEENFLRDTARYDERFFDLTTERSSGSPLSGIYERNPYGSNEPWFDFGGTESSTAPSGSPVASIGETPTLPSTNTTPIVDNIFGLAPTVPEDEVLKGVVPDDEILEPIVPEDDILQGVVPDPSDPTITPDPNPPEIGTEPLPGETLPEETLREEELPAYVDPEVEELPSSTPPGFTGGGEVPTAPDTGRAVAELKDRYTNELTRLAKIMRIENVPPIQKLMAGKQLQQLMMQMQALENLDVLAGDITARLDPKATEQIQRVRKTGETRSGTEIERDLIQEAINEANA